MCPKRKVSTIVLLNYGGLIVDKWVVRSIKWYIVGSCTTVWNAEALNMTHSARCLSVMSLHLHEHGDSGNVTKSSNEVCTEWKQFVGQSIKTASSKLKLK